MAWNVSADPAKPKAALRFFRNKLKLTDPEYRAVRESARAKAFYAAGATRLDVVSDIWKGLERAIANGDTFADFKKSIGQHIGQVWGSPSSPVLETVFRTNVL